MWKNKQQALDALCSKYGAACGTINEKNGKQYVADSNGKETILLPWRVERRFFELKKMMNEGTLEGISTLRFASMTSSGCLCKLLVKELDLAVWLTGKKITSVFAVCGGDKAANVIAKLEAGLNVSVECGTGLPEGADPIDRHEIIASRGVASDRVVDTQIPQASVYLFTNAGEKKFTDTDEELFGLCDEDILLVRAAFAVLSHPEYSDEWNNAFADAEQKASAVFESDKQKKVIKF